ncbi:MAG TPA: PA domain-containing protein [Anaerolineales bacterium]|nr:PA domain-containing protein [Anaerolineales bacterium]
MSTRPFRRFISLFMAFALSVVFFSSVPAAGSNPKRDGGLQNALNALNSRARAYGLLNQAPPSDPTPLLANNFDVLGHNSLGGQDSNGDVWVHGNFAYVGTWGSPCTGRGVKIVDVSDLTAPRVIGAVARRAGTSAEDVVVRQVNTPFFTGDLLAVGLQRCGDQPALNNSLFGPEFWDVTNPYRPVRLSKFGITTGGGGVHELDLFQRGGNVYALLAAPFAEFFDPFPGGDFRILDVTDPRHPVQVGVWGAFDHGLTNGPFDGLGSFGVTYAHSARVSDDGMKAYLSYWDLGVLTLDISDVTNPVFISQTQYPTGSDGDAHSVSEYHGTSQHFLLQNDEDYDPRSPAFIYYAGGTGLGNESPSGPPLWDQPGHSLTAGVVQAANQGCEVSDYPPDTAGRIAVMRTPFPFFDPAGGEEPLCLHQDQEAAAEAAGAVAAVHDFISTATSPQWFDVGSVGIPVLFTDHATAQGMVAAGSATLEAQEPAWGYLRIFDAQTGIQVASFDDLPGVRELPPPPGDWSIHNNEVAGDRSYIAWYSNGIVAVDLSPLNNNPPGDPVMVGQFLPPGAPSSSPFLWDNIPLVWGVAIRESDNVIFVSDINSGLWIIRPTGAAAP